MTNDGMNKIRAEARSFPELKPPSEAELVAQEEIHGDTYYFYKCGNDYLYESASGYAFKQRMDKVQKSRKFRIKKAGA